MLSVTELVENAAQKVLSDAGYSSTTEPQTSSAETSLQTLAWCLGEPAYAYEQTLAQFATAAIAADRAQRGIPTLLAETLDDRENPAAAAWIRSMDPDEVHCFYVGPLLDRIEQDAEVSPQACALAHKIAEEQIESEAPHV